jgi:hypothetical protein
MSVSPHNIGIVPRYANVRDRIDANQSPGKATMKNEKLARALELMASGLTAYAASKKSGCPKGTLYAHLERKRMNELKGKAPCPCCGSMVDANAIKQN